MYLRHSEGRLRGEYSEQDEPVYFVWQRTLFRQIMWPAAEISEHTSIPNLFSSSVSG